MPMIKAEINKFGESIMSLDMNDQLWWKGKTTTYSKNKDGEVDSMKLVSTKRCPVCNDDQLGLIRTQNIKICSNCSPKFTIIPWHLDPGQKAIL
jgi:hypothetical protein